jgi:hypothetical protein
VSNRIHNNTAYRGAGAGAATAVFGSGKNSFSRNNLLFARSGGARVASSYTGENSVQSHNLVATTNPFSATSFDDPSDFQLSDPDGNGDGRNEGAAIPNTQTGDFFGNVRPAEGEWDIGACEYGSPGGADTPPAAPILLP